MFILRKLVIDLYKKNKIEIDLGEVVKSNHVLIPLIHESKLKRMSKKKGRKTTKKQR